IESGVPPEKIAVVYDGVPILEVSTGTGVLRLEKRKAPADLEVALREAGIVVYLTESEGLGSGALLAMSAGLPVVASKVGGLPEAIVHRENGLLVGGAEQEVEAAVAELSADR